MRSYMNYAVTNGAVLMQTYWQPGRADILKTTEEQVRGILQGAFPGRNIIGINAESVNLWGGGIHCITQHMPAS
ncbi:agmatine deiminase family protein [Pelotomaculum propionicicum]|nr:agmatine deiminase family protein [Pelotomaculum propionicicum]